MSVAFAICPRCLKVLQVEVIDWPGVPVEIAKHLAEHPGKDEPSSAKSEVPGGGAIIPTSERDLPHALPSHRPSTGRPHSRPH